MKTFIITLLIMSIMGCSTPLQQVKQTPVSSHIEKNKDGSFSLTINRDKLNKINEGLECLKAKHKTTTINQGWTNSELALFLISSVLIGAGSGAYIGSR